ncbi:MAG TPA: glycosyltransferase family 2 protein [Patescibacteria group bacterium]|nr:glycosyltransferase family 2 protein [Patescibacteria group bacterium]
MLDLSIIIVSYNTKNFVPDCLTSIHKTIKKNTFEVFIVDNASTDNSSEDAEKFIKQKGYKNMFVLKNKINLGFSKANNLGVKKSKGRYVLFLNPDTVIHEETIDFLIDYMNQNKDVGALTCKLSMPNGKIDDASHRGFPTPWNSLTHFLKLGKVFSKSRLFSGYSQGWKNLSKTHEIDALAGAFMLTRREAGEEVKWWDEDYFFYGEDLQFCLDLAKKGWKIMYIPKVSILHYKGVSGGLKKVSQKITTASKETRKRATKARFNAMKIFYKKNYQNKYPAPINWLVFSGIALKEKISSI